MYTVNEKAKPRITVWAFDEVTGTSIGINGTGELFMGNNESGFNLADTPRNRRRLEQDYKRYTGKTATVPKT